MKKILFLTHCYPFDIKDKRGHFFLPVIKRLRELDIQVIVITPWWYREHTIYKEHSGFFGEIVYYFKWKDKRLSNISLFNPISIINILRFIIYWMKTIKTVLKNTNGVTAVLAAWGFPAGLLLRCMNLKNIRTAIWWLGSDYNSLDHKIFSPILRFILNGTNENWTNSHRMALGLNKHMDEKAFFVPLLTNHEMSNLSDNFIPVSLKTIISIGRLEPVKGIDIGIQAVSALLDQDIKLKYIIIGDGPQKEYLQSLIGKNNKDIHLLGYLSDNELNKELKNSNFVMIPSRIDGMPLVFFEALAARKPVIATDVGDIKKCVSGSTLGLVSHPENIDELSKNIKKALNGKLKFDENRANRVFKEYSLDNTISGIISLLEYSTKKK